MKCTINYKLALNYKIPSVAAQLERNDDLNVTQCYNIVQGDTEAVKAA